MSATAFAMIGGVNRPCPVVPRTVRGNFCGVRVPGLAPVPGGPSDTSLVFSPFYDRYGAADRQYIRAAWKRAGCIDVKVSITNSAEYGRSPEQFADTCQELVNSGFYPLVFGLGEPQNQWPADQIIAWMRPYLDVLIKRGLIKRFSIGWQLDLYCSPETLRVLIDTLCPSLVAVECKCYVHFTPGRSAWQFNGQDFADFWNRNVAKLVGLLHQKVLSQDKVGYWFDSGGICDVLSRFAGNDFVSQDSGFGHPFDFIADEITAYPQFFQGMSESDGNAWGTIALQAPPQSGPGGLTVGVMGSDNGQD